MVKEFLRRLPAAGSALDVAGRARRYLLHRREGEAQLQRSFQRTHGRPVDMDNPTLFTEKLLAWLIRLHRTQDRRFSSLANKLDSRDYVRERLGPEFLIDLYWQGTDPNRLPFDSLPDRYMIKPSHSSGHTIKGGPDLDRSAAVAEMSDWLATNYYWLGREYQYLHMTPRIMVEEYIDDGTEGAPLDYSFWCFHGEPRLVQVRKFPRRINQFYDLDWNLVDLRAREGIAVTDVPVPDRFAEMKAAAQTLAQGLEFVRVDLYAPPGRILFSELTFTPAAGRAVYRPEGWDRRLGDLWEWG